MVSARAHDADSHLFVWEAAPKPLPETMLQPSQFDTEPDERITHMRFVDAPEDDEELSW